MNARGDIGGLARVRERSGLGNARTGGDGNGDGDAGSLCDVRFAMMVVMTVGTILAGTN